MKLRITVSVAEGPDTGEILETEIVSLDDPHVDTQGPQWAIEVAGIMARDITRQAAKTLIARRTKGAYR